MAQLPLLVAGYGGRVIVHGMGVGPLEDPAARAAVRLTGRVSHAVSVRDEASRALLERLAEARAYAARIVPEARGEASRTRTVAEGYKTASIARA